MGGRSGRPHPPLPPDQGPLLPAPKNSKTLFLCLRDPTHKNAPCVLALLIPPTPPKPQIHHPNPSLADSPTSRGPKPTRPVDPHPPPSPSPPTREPPPPGPQKLKNTFFVVFNLLPPTDDPPPTTHGPTPHAHRPPGSTGVGGSGVSP